MVVGFTWLTNVCCVLYVNGFFYVVKFECFFTFSSSWNLIYSTKNRLDKLSFTVIFDITKIKK